MADDPTDREGFWRRAGQMTSTTILAWRTVFLAFREFDECDRLSPIG
jgi:hypothetical protein